MTTEPGAHSAMPEPATMQPPPAGTPRSGLQTWAHQQLTLLRPQYEGRWDIWYVPRHPVGYIWCAKPCGARCATINVRTPDDLIAEIRRQEQSPARERDLSDLTTSELQRVSRALAASAALAVPSSGARMMILKEMEAIDRELAERGSHA